MARLAAPGAMGKGKAAAAWTALSLGRGTGPATTVVMELVLASATVLVLELGRDTGPASTVVMELALVLVCTLAPTGVGTGMRVASPTTLVRCCRISSVLRISAMWAWVQHPACPNSCPNSCLKCPESSCCCCEALCMVGVGCLAK